MATDSSQKVLLQEYTLDRILRFLDGKSLRKARLVCHTWNDNILSNFHRKMNLVIHTMKRNGKDTKAVLFSVDERVLSSISICPLNSTVKPAWLKTAFDFLQTSGNFGRVRALRLNLDERGFDNFIQVIADGGLSRLQELVLYVKFNKGDNHYKCMKTVPTGALPALRHFEVFPFIEGNQGLPSNQDLDRFWNENLSVAIQSFVGAAVNLNVVDTTLALDLTGRNVKKLTLHVDSHDLLQEEEAIRMICSVSESLTYLNFNRMFPVKGQPMFPNLETLIIRPLGSKPFLDLSLVPKLKKVNCPFWCIPWKYIPKHLPPAGNLKVVEVRDVNIHLLDDADPKVKPFRQLFSPGLSHLTMIFNSSIVTIKQLLEFLDVVYNRNGTSANKSSVLEFLHVKEKCRPWNKSVENDYSWFARILEKLGNDWRSVRMTNFEFAVKPTWREKEVRLFHGERIGIVKLSNVNGQCANVSLEIKN